MGEAGSGVDRSVQEHHLLLPVGEAARTRRRAGQDQRPGLAVSGKPGPCPQLPAGLLPPLIVLGHAGHANRHRTPSVSPEVTAAVPDCIAPTGSEGMTHGRGRASERHHAVWEWAHDIRRS